MSDYLIYTDASADIDPALLERYDIRFVAMHYTVGEEERICTNLEAPDFLKRFYNAQREGKETHTSQVTPHAYIETFTPFLQEGKSILYLSLSSGLTKTYESVCLAASELAEQYGEAKVVPVDTLCATGGMGLLLEAAAKNREAGLPAEENADWLNSHRLSVAHWFMVDDLMYLKRGGRIPATTAVLGTALNIKPILKIDDEGKLVTLEKKRGYKLAIRELANKYAATRDETQNRVYIVHGDCPDKADELEQQLLEINPRADIIKMTLCPIIGAHTGPGMLAVIFFGNRSPEKED
ncbi:MAG: DegV family protein [Roseburia sp.]|nr:DegV family protein [Roseburia sp.]MCM1098375.1 DegV family protein [Ruminococcus flavefaciens]